MTRSSQHTDESRVTQLAAIVIALISLASVIVDGRDRRYPALAMFDIGHAMLALGIVLAMRIRPKLSVRMSELAFVGVTAPFAVGILLPQIYDLAHQSVAEPMLAHHFLLLGIAVAAPTGRTGAGMIGAFSIHGLALWFSLIRGSAQDSAGHEPWFTLFIAGVSLALLYTRVRRRGLEHRLAAAEGRAHTLAQVSRMLLALRDRANTPLQTLELAISLLEQDHGGDRRLELMRSAHAHLVTVQQALSDRGEAGPVVGATLDLEVSLRELLGEARHHPPDDDSASGT